MTLNIEQVTENSNAFDNIMQWRPMVIPDICIEHASPAEQTVVAGLTSSQIAATVFNILGQTREALEMVTVA